jgi:uncharacterized protein GlcG (DUF336 family)
LSVVQTGQTISSEAYDGRVGFVEQRHPSLEQALALLERVRAEAEGRSLALAACVVDAGGNEIASQRMDGAALGARQLAAGKAYTAVLWGVRTGEFMSSTQPGGADWGFNTTDPRIVVYAGGVPLYAGGLLVGAVGASGSTADDDEACVLAAAAAAGFATDAETRNSGSGPVVITGDTNR